MIRNLLYNCFASKWSDEWWKNIERLCRYTEAFNGRKIVLVKTDPNAVDPAELRAKLSPLGADTEFLYFPNDLKLGEVVGFVDGLSQLESLNPNEATFYAHLKGTKYRKCPDVYMSAIRRWRNRMYDECLNDVGRVEKFLEDYACCGCYKQVQRVAPLPEKAYWHFAGTFWWVKHSALFSLPDWREVHQSFHGVEGYLGSLLPPNSAYCLYNKNLGGGLYSTEGIFKCKKCKHEYVSVAKMNRNPIKVCPKCFKRQAYFFRSIEDDE